MPNNTITSNETIITIIRKIFDDYDEKNGAMQKIDYTKRATAIVDTWQKAMNGKGLTTELICELHRIICDDVYIPINDSKGGISGFAKAGEYREIQVISPSALYEGSKIVHFQPKDISANMERLISTMSGVLASSLQKEILIENIIAFILELLTIHPFVNQNGRISQVLMELFAYHLGIEAFNISNAVKKDKKAIVIAEEKAIITQNVNIFLKTIRQINKNAGVA